jgi:hypothetical protein
LVSLRKVGPDLWRIDEIAGPQDTLPPNAMWSALEEKLKKAGVLPVPMNPGLALSTLDRAAKRQKVVDDFYDGLDDALDVAGD